LRYVHAALQGLVRGLVWLLPSLDGRHVSPGAVMSSMPTNPYLSSVHAAIFEKAITKADGVDAMKHAAAKHGPWLLGHDKTRLRQIYMARLMALGGCHGGI